MYSLSTTCDNFLIPPSFHYNNRYEGAGRAAWGCICESRKILQSSLEEYTRRKEKILISEKELLDEKDGLEDEELIKWKERMGTVMSEKAGVERKWRER